MEAEMEAIAKTGMREILLLTGESRKASGIDYIVKGIQIARKYFSTIGLEIYPVNSEEYALLREAGADFVTVFQETYDGEKYEEMHQAGAKRCFPYRVAAQERALMGGMRGVGFGVLLGLADFRKDMYSVAVHASMLQKKYPHAEIALSFPRLRPYKNHEETNPNDVHETQLLQMMLACRIFLPFASFTISTRERAGFRDHVLPLAATKISAGVDVGIGGHTEENTEKGDAQFEISDPRSLAEIHAAILEQGMQPVYTDYINTNTLC
jgi:2-iminoacetate synthase